MGVFDDVVQIGVEDDDGMPRTLVETGNERVRDWAEEFFDVDPTLNWRFETGNWIASSPTILNGTVYVGSYHNNTYALDAETGEELWRFETGNGVFSSPTVADSIVYIGSYDNNTYALDTETGEELWRFETGDWIVSSPTVADGTLYIGSFDNTTYALDAETGEELWHFETKDWIFSSPTVADGIVYIGSADGDTYTLDAETGEKIWRFETGNRITSSPTVADGTVYIGSDDNHVYAIDAVTSGASDGSRVNLGTLGHHGGSLTDPDITPFAETTALKTGKTTPDSLAGKIRVETSVASNTTVELLRSTARNYSLSITAPDSAENVTFYLQEQAVSSSQNVSNLTMYLDGEEHSFVVSESAGPGRSPWLAFNVPHFSMRTVTFTTETDTTTCITNAVAGNDSTIDLTEIQTAINWWAESEEVPDTGGQTISLTEIQRLIDTWAEDESVTCS